jgi:hypothetical protein
MGLLHDSYLDNSDARSYPEKNYSNYIFWYTCDNLKEREMPPFNPRKLKLKYATNVSL